jgi:hypothetical protein
MEIIGRGYTVPEFRAYLKTLPEQMWLPRFIVVHNTSSPDLRLYTQDWVHRKNWTGEQWMRNLRDYYSGKGWTGGPHLFVAPDKIWLLNPLWRAGVHTPSWNRFTWGVETVGEFEREPFDGTLRANLVGALAALHEHAHLDPADYKLGVRGLHFHKEDPGTTHRSCPGRNMVKVQLVADVVAAMGGGEEVHDQHLPSVEAQSADTSTLPTEASSVRWVQQQLNSRGYGPLVVDNIVGPATRAAVRRYQSDHPPLVVDGIAGPMTRLSLARSRG